jgi:tetratricopeptide (TPR) repeat protein
MAARVPFELERSAMKANSRTLAITLLASAFATAAWAQELGHVHFQTSCTPQAQQKFDRALAMVHSFVYPDSVAAFTEAAAADPECAIAYWGIAISHRPNPLILPLAAAVLKNGLAAVEKGKAIGAKTERERDWLAAIELYYKDYDKVDQTARSLAYEKAMELLMQKYPDDPEAAIFYALALNETALPSDKTYAKQLKAGAILEKVLMSQPDHPGALHYLIHSYDYPLLAQRALAAANKYARIAPAAQHAQHMPAHPIPCSGYGRSRSSRIPNRGKPLRSKLPDFGRGLLTRPCRTTWILWSTPSCKWVRSSARNRSATIITPSRNSGSKLWLVILASPRCRRALRWSAKPGKKPRRFNREAASFRKLRRSPISPAPLDPPVLAISLLPSKG